MPAGRQRAHVRHDFRSAAPQAAAALRPVGKQRRAPLQCPRPVARRMPAACMVSCMNGANTTHGEISTVKEFTPAVTGPLTQYPMNYAVYLVRRPP